MSAKSSIELLSGSDNYPVWVMHMRAILVDENYDEIIVSDEVSDLVNKKALCKIHLCLKKGPLMQVQNITRAHETWVFLENLYRPKGFSSKFLLSKEFFSCKLNNFDSMENYLNKIRELTDDLKSKKLTIPKELIMAWILDNLTPQYDNIVTNITQSLRNNEEAYSLDQLFSNLIDESKRQGSIDNNTEMALYTSLRNKYKNKKVTKNQYRVNKSRYCTNCKKQSHITADCYHLFPNKAPPSWNKASTERNIVEKNNNDNEICNTLLTDDLTSINTDAFEPVDESMISLLDEDIILTDHQVYMTTQNDNKKADNKTENLTTSVNNTNTKRFDNNKFILDTAATQHIICEKSFFTSIKCCNKIVRWGDAKSIKITGTGNVFIKFKNNNKPYILKNCLYMPEIGMNIISQGQMDNNYESLFKYNKVLIKYQGNIIAQGNKIDNLYYLDVERVIKPGQLFITNNDNKNKNEQNQTIDIKALHNRMGHINNKCLNKITDNTLGFRYLTNKEKTDLNNCEICLEGKFTNKINKTINHKRFDYLEKISSDICGPFDPNTYDNYKYFITFMDIYSRYLEVKLLRSKDEAYDAFTQYINFHENNKYNKRIRIFATDNGTEYTNKRIKTLLEKKGIIHQLSPVYTKEPNGIIERINRTILNKVRCLLANANLPKSLWGEACLTAVNLYNRTPHAALNYKTPFEMKNNQKPNISSIRTFGSICFYKNKGNHITKLDKRAIKGVLVGFNHPLYKVYSLETKRCLWVRDIKIIENSFHKGDNQNITADKQHMEIYLNSPRISQNHNENNRTSHTESSISETVNRDYTYQDLTPDNLLDVNTEHGENKKYKTVKWTKSAVNNNYGDEIDELALIVNINSEPNTYKQAITSPQSQEWQKAMQAEVDELQNQNTWSLTELPHDKTPLKGRWVYKIKTDLNGNITKYKARWVVKGFNQILGIDYLDTFSTTCRPESYRIIFILAINQKWHLTQYDVKNAFIHAAIDKEIYVEQPHGFIKIEDLTNNENKHTNSKKTSLYCKLNKALYGLKQSPRLWYEHLLGVLKNHGFIAMPYDSAIFIHNELRIIIICHVDDLIITGPDKNKINDLVSKITKQIKLEKIGNINQFLGMEITTEYDKQIINMNQNKYTVNLLERFDKNNMNPVTSPVEMGINLERSLETASETNIHKYQQQVGSLIYLAINTRPDIAFAVNRCARYMANPNESHFRALDRIWKYLNKFPSIGLSYNCSEIDSQILGYTDADWGGDTISRKSTSGYLFQLKNNIISWLSMQQKTIALSSCEAEYMALKEAIKESIYLNNLLTFYNKLLHINLSSEIPKLLTDSESAMKLANNPEFHKRTKHIDITYHFIRETIKDKNIQLHYVNTKVQKADGFTKGLDTIKHKSFLQSLNLR